MPEEFEDLSVRFDLSFHFVLDLASHESELLLSLVGLKISSDLDKFDTSLFYLAMSDKLARRMWHERREPDEKNYSPGYLDTQR